MQIVFVRGPTELLGVCGHWDRARDLADKCLELKHVMEGLDGRQREIGNARSALQNDARAYAQMRDLKTSLGVLLADIKDAREEFNHVLSVDVFEAAPVWSKARS